MASFTFEQLRGTLGATNLSTQERERLSIQIALVEHVVEALDRHREAVVIAGAAEAVIAGFTGAPHAQLLAQRLGGDVAVERLANLLRY